MYRIITHFRHEGKEHVSPCTGRLGASAKNLQVVQQSGESNQREKASIIAVAIELTH